MPSDHSAQEMARRRFQTGNGAATGNLTDQRLMSAHADIASSRKISALHGIPIGGVAAILSALHDHKSKTLAIRASAVTIFSELNQRHSVPLSLVSFTCLSRLL